MLHPQLLQERVDVPVSSSVLEKESEIHQSGDKDGVRNEEFENC